MAEVESKATEEVEPSFTEFSEETDAEWLAWESDPEFYNTFASKIGLDLTKYGFREMWDLSPENWPMLMPDFKPEKVRAVILLFPSDVGAEERKSDTVDVAARYTAEDGTSGAELTDSKLFYFYQLDCFGNACGPISVIHALANAADVSFVKDSLIEKLMTNWKSIDASAIPGSMSLDKGTAKKPKDGEWTRADKKLRALYQERGLRLLTDKDIHKASDSIATVDEAQTSAPKKGDRTGAHFIAFVYRTIEVNVCVGDDFETQTHQVIVELDGRKEFPILHGSIRVGASDSTETKEYTSTDTFAADCINVIQDKFMAGSTGYGFSVAMLESKE